MAKSGECRPQKMLTERKGQNESVDLSFEPQFYKEEWTTYKGSNVCDGRDINLMDIVEVSITSAAALGALGIKSCRWSMENMKPPLEVPLFEFRGWKKNKVRTRRRMSCLRKPQKRSSLSAVPSRYSILGKFSGSL